MKGAEADDRNPGEHGWRHGFSLAGPLWSTGHVHARRIYNVGDWLLPRKERLECPDEKSRQCAFAIVG